MFFLLPLGHDRSVYGYPWVTIGLIAACSVIWLVTYSAERAAMEGINDAAAVVERVHQEYPKARVTWEMRGLPKEITGEVFGELMDPTHTEAVPGDAELDRAMRDLVAQLNRLPVLRFGYRPGAPSIGTMFSGLFMHGGFFHLLGNMLFLWLTGSVIECFWGRWRFLALYLGSGVLATLLFHLFNRGSLTPLVGASGAIAGLMGAFLVGHPRTRVKIGYLIWIFVFIRVGSFYIPAWGALFAWLVQQVVGVVTGLSGGGDGVAYWAHVGGFAVGAAAALAMRYFDWFPDYAKEWLEDEKEHVPKLNSQVAAEPLAKRRKAWMDQVAPPGVPATQGGLPTVPPPDIDSSRRADRGPVEAIAIPGFDDGSWQPAEAEPFMDDPSYLDPDDDAHSIPLAPPEPTASPGGDGLPDDIIPQSAMYEALPAEDRYRGSGEAIELPGFESGPTLPEPPGGFDDD